MINRRIDINDYTSGGTLYRRYRLSEPILEEIYIVIRDMSGSGGSASGTFAIGASGTLDFYEESSLHGYADVSVGRDYVDLTLREVESSGPFELEFSYEEADLLVYGIKSDKSLVEVYPREEIDEMMNAPIVTRTVTVEFSTSEAHKAYAGYAAIPAVSDYTAIGCRIASGGTNTAAGSVIAGINGSRVYVHAVGTNAGLRIEAIVTIFYVKASRIPSV